MVVTVLRWTLAVVVALLSVGAIASLAVAVGFDNAIWNDRARRLRAWIWVLGLAWFNAEIWGRVAYTILHWNR